MQRTSCNVPLFPERGHATTCLTRRTSSEDGRGTLRHYVGTPGEPLQKYAELRALPAEYSLREGRSPP